MKSNKSDTAYRTISEVAELLELQQHVLRFWETKFTQIKPLKRGGNRRFYRPQDIEMLRAIKFLLHRDGYTIRGVQKLFKEQGVKTTIEATLGDGPVEPVPVIEAPSKRIESPKPQSINATDVDEDIVVPSSNADQSTKLSDVLSELKEIRSLLD